MDNVVQVEESNMLMRFPSDTPKFTANEYNLPFPDSTFDAVTTCSGLHWVNDLPRALKEACRVLKPDGVFLGCILGGDTLYELRTSLQLADLERLGGISPHISPMVHSRDMGGLLKNAGFTLLTVDTEEIVINYPSMFELMEDLQAMGESNAIDNRKHFVPKNVFIAASAAYRAIYGDEKSIPATFQAIYLIGWKPHASQPKPLSRQKADFKIGELPKNLP